MNDKIRKVVRNGNVAVLYSPGFGAGWRTWNYDKYKEELLFSPELVEAIEKKEKNIEQIAKRVFPEAFCGGASQLEIVWIPEGTRFRIREYDGSESIEYASDVDWEVA